VGEPGHSSSRENDRRCACVEHDKRSDREESEMVKVIKCECGYVVRGQTDEELLEHAERHIQETHPDLVGNVSREDLLAMSEDE
jgi:predicted small metal-binding protein